MSTTTPTHTRTTLTSSWRELDDREASAGQIRVAILWHSDTGRTLVSVLDRATGEVLHIEPQDGQKVSTVYQHPYAFADQAWERQSRP